MEAAVKNPMHVDAFLFGFYTGMRRGEILALRWEEVDLGKGLSRWRRPRRGCRLSCR
jgi:integrase